MTFGPPTKPGRVDSRCGCVIRNRQFSAAEVWEWRDFNDLDGDVELGTRTIKIALRRPRKCARAG
jgi:uncharacterized protein with von Willebrand factor type A (vWA) domain